MKTLKLSFSPGPRSAVVAHPSRTCGVPTLVLPECGLGREEPQAPCASPLADTSVMHHLVPQTVVFTGEAHGAAHGAREALARLGLVGLDVFG